MDYDSLQKVGSRMGTGTMVVMDDKTCPVGFVLNLERFFSRESCGWCTPCREGLWWTERLSRNRKEGSLRTSIPCSLCGTMGIGRFCVLLLAHGTSAERIKILSRGFENIFRGKGAVE
jgi:NADH-quinone oxidoreductase subunit F